MHRTKKMTVVTTAAALLMGAAGMSSAVADHKADHYKVTICHATGQANPPYNRIHVSKNAEEAHDHHQHYEDVLLGRDDSNTKQCPTTPVPPGENNKVTICHLLPGGTYDRIHVSENSDEHNAHKGHGSDIISRDNDDDDDCPMPDGDEDETCSVSSSSGDSTTNQAGLVNIAALNGNAGSLRPNLLCGADVVKNVNVLGEAIFGGDAAEAGDDCNEESTSGDSTTNQAGLVNIAALNGNAGSLRPNLLCGADVVKNVNVLGGAIFGGDAAEAGDDCNEESTSGDSTSNQGFLVNVAALNGNAGSLLPNLACGADIVEDLNVLGFALGGSSLGGSLLGSELLVGPAGILTDAPGFLLSGLTADVRVLANVLVLL